MFPKYQYLNAQSCNRWNLQKMIAIITYFGPMTASLNFHTPAAWDSHGHLSNINLIANIYIYMNFSI